jgi:hypothetical protein
MTESDFEYVAWYFREFRKFYTKAATSFPSPKISLSQCNTDFYTVRYNGANLLEIALLDTQIRRRLGVRKPHHDVHYTISC